MSAAPSELAALVVAGAVQEAAQKLPGAVNENAAEELAELLPSETPEPAPVAEAPAAEAERANQIVDDTAPAAPILGPLEVPFDFALEPVSDDELAELGVEDAEEEEEDLPPAAAAEEADEEADGAETWEDPEVKKLRRQLAAAQKQAEHEKSLRVAANAKEWAKEAQRRYRFADITGIEADSKRAFMRAAALSHNATLKVIRPHLEAAEAELRAKVKAESEAAWGKPLDGPGATPVVTAQVMQGLEEVRRTGDLVKILAYKRQHGLS
jgi:hypothetical protein